MADDLKKNRTQALSKFSRNLKSFTKLLEDNSPKSLVVPQFEVVNSCWKVLEDVHDEYLGETDDDIEEGVAGGVSYLDGPGERRTTALLAYSAYLKAADQSEDDAAKQKAHEARELADVRQEKEAKALQAAEEAKLKAELSRQFGSLKLEVETGIVCFSQLARGLLESLDGASEEVQRSEWLKAESEFSKLKDKQLQLASLETDGQDVTDVKKKFEEDAAVAFLNLQKWVLPQLTVSTAVVKTSGGSSSSTTRRERVSLPEFKGDIKASPFLKYGWLSGRR